MGLSFYVIVKESKHTSYFWYSEITNTPVVYLNNHYWENNPHSNLDFEEIMFHELGHCLLNQEHSENGIMREHNLGKNHYRLNRSSLIKKLFATNKASTSIKSLASKIPDTYTKPAIEYEYLDPLFEKLMTVTIPELDWMLKSTPQSPKFQLD